MLLMSSSLRDQAVLSVRDGHPIAQASEPIIDPNNLKIIGWWCDGAGGRTVLLAEDVRERLAKGLIVNEDAALSNPADLHRQAQVLQINYQLIDKPVKSGRQKLGKVKDYCYNEGLFVQKLYVERPLFRAFGNDTLIIDRSQIVEVNDKFILVKDADVKVAAAELDEAAATEAAPAT